MPSQLGQKTQQPNQEFGISQVSGIQNPQNEIQANEILDKEEISEIKPESSFEQ